MSDFLGLGGIYDQLQTVNRALQQLITVLSGGVAVNPSPRVFVVASLPTAGNTNGAYAFASNGRKGGEGVGAGTGVPVYWNAATSQWFTYSANVLVTA